MMALLQAATASTTPLLRTSDAAGHGSGWPPFRGILLGFRVALVSSGR
jgi:hypothetical protein